MAVDANGFAKKSAGYLWDISSRLSRIAEIWQKGSIPYDPLDGADMMALSFAAKQAEHMSAVRLLIQKTFYRDAFTISRTMLEGMAQLLWAMDDTPARTDRWFWFGAIKDLRTLNKRLQSGKSVDPNDLARLQVYIDEHGDNYLRPGIRKELARSIESGSEYCLPSDPWTQTWTSVTVETMFAQIGGETLYEYFFRGASPWMHWDSGALLSATNSDSRGITGLSKNDWISAAFALQAACRALGQTLVVLNNRFGLNHDEQLDTIANDLHSMMKSLQQDDRFENTDEGVDQDPSEE